MTRHPDGRLLPRSQLSLRPYRTRARPIDDVGAAASPWSSLRWCFPIFILVLFGIIEFGFMLYSQMTVSNAAREAARVSVVDPDPCSIQDLANATARAAASGLNTSYLTMTGAVASTVRLPPARPRSKATRSR